MKKYFENEQQDLHEQIGNKITEKVLDDIIETVDSTKAQQKKYLKNNYLRF